MEGFSNSLPSWRGKWLLYTEFSHLTVLCIQCCVRATSTSINSLNKHSIQCDRVFLLLFPNVMESRSLLVVYVFNFYQTLRVVPHGTKGTGPGFVTRPVYLRSQLRNNTNTVSTLILPIHLLDVLCTRYTGIAHHRALQTSGRGWAGSKAVHGMECSGARSLYWRSLSAGAAACSVPYCQYREVCSPTRPNA